MALNRVAGARAPSLNKPSPAVATQIAPDEATRPFPNTEAELRAELMRVRTEAATALSSAEDRLASAARAMNAQKDPARRTLSDQAELQKRASRLAAELLEARTERDDARHELDELRADLEAMEAARDVLEAALEARDLRGQMAEGRAGALEQRAAAADAALLRSRANAEALESSLAEARAQKDALESTLSSVRNDATTLRTALRESMPADQLVRETQTEIDQIRNQAQSARPAQRQKLQATLEELQSELALAQARSEAVHNIIQFANTGSGGASSENLLSQVQQLQRSVPEVAVSSPTATPGSPP